VPHPGTGWGQGLATGVGVGWAAHGGDQSKGRMSSHILFESNEISRSWGESIDPLLAQFVTARHNRITNVYSVGVYLDNARHCLLDSNFVHMDDPSFWRDFGGYQAAASGFAVGTEAWYPLLIDVVNVSVTNNLCVGVSRCVGGYSMGHHSSGIRIEGNTMYASTVAGIDMPDNRGATAGNIFRDNFVSMATGADGAHVAGGVRIGALDLPHWSVEANVFAVAGGNATLGMRCGGGPDHGGAGEADAGAAGAADCQSALPEVCPGQKGKGAACHQCAFAHKAALTKDGCSFLGSPPRDIMAYCKPGFYPPPGPSGPGPPPPSPHSGGPCTGTLPDSESATVPSTAFQSVDPQQFFAKAGDEGFDTSDPASFRPRATGPLAAGRGAPFLNVSGGAGAHDFFERIRPRAAPSIGFAEESQE
jgi:hypothetical protein